MAKRNYGVSVAGRFRNEIKGYRTQSNTQTWKLERGLDRDVGSLVWSPLHWTFDFNDLLFYELGARIETEARRKAKRIAHEQKIRKLAGAGSKQRRRAVRKTVRGKRVAGS